MGISLRSLQLIGYEALVRVRPTVYSLAAEDSAVIAFIVILFVKKANNFLLQMVLLTLSGTHILFIPYLNSL